MKHEVFSRVTWASFRAMVSPLSGFRENWILRNHDTNLTPNKSLEGQNMFFWYLVQNVSGKGAPKSI
jgi:hypothetical protein